MKKNILLIVAALFLFLGNQSLIAQEKISKDDQSLSVKEAKVNVKMKVDKLAQSLELNDSQRKQVYNLFLKMDEKSQKVNGIEDIEARKERKSKIDIYIKRELSEILTQKQFDKYLKLVKG